MMGIPGLLEPASSGHLRNCSDCTSDLSALLMTLKQLTRLVMRSLLVWTSKKLWQDTALRSHSALILIRGPFITLRNVPLHRHTDFHIHCWDRWSSDHHEIVNLLVRHEIVFLLEGWLIGVALENAFFHLYMGFKRLFLNFQTTFASNGDLEKCVRHCFF